MADDMFRETFRKIGDEREREFDALAKKADRIEIPPELHETLKRMVREADREGKAEERKAEKKRRRSRAGRMAAIAAVCLLMVNFIALETSDAYRSYVLQLFFDADAGGATVLTETEYDMIGEWEDYWYPSWLPDGYSLSAAEENEGEKAMLFRSSPDQREMVIFQYPKEWSLTFDTDNLENKSVRVGMYQGYLFFNEEEEQVILIWSTEDRVIVIEFPEEEEKTILQIGEEMTYIE